jgi:dTDP-4-dehydrorhamnose reductase
MRVLVTGAAGLVGGRTTLELLRRGHAVIAVHRTTVPQWAPVPNAALAQCELSSADAVEKLFSESAPLDAVIHPAAAIDLEWCEKNPEGAWRDNVLATANLSSAARKAGAHLVHVSTDYVFDGKRGPYPEDAVPCPRGVYPLSKHASEQVARMLAPGCAIARTAVVYGALRSARPNFAMWLVENLSAGKTVNLFEDQWISPSLADDVARMLAELAERKLDGFWNTCGGDHLTRVSFGEALCAQFGFDPKLIRPVKMAEAGMLATRPPRAGLTPDKVRARLQEHPLPLREALARFHTSWSEGAR